MNLISAGSISLDSTLMLQNAVMPIAICFTWNHRNCKYTDSSIDRLKNGAQHYDTESIGRPQKEPKNRFCQPM